MTTKEGLEEVPGTGLLAKADATIVGRVDGMGNPSTEGSYVWLIVDTRDGHLRNYSISEGAASLMASTIAGIQDARLSQPQDEGSGVRVKALEWEKHPSAELWRADCLTGRYQVYAVIGQTSWAYDGYDGITRSNGDAADIEAAKAAAQEHYSKAILSTIEPAGNEAAASAWAYQTPSDVDAIGHFANWQWRVSVKRPTEVPTGTVRNITPLFDPALTRSTQIKASEPGEGMVLVPREPTDSMLMHGGNKHSFPHTAMQEDVLAAGGIYRAMISAAQSNPKGGRGE